MKNQNIITTLLFTITFIFLIIGCEDAVIDPVDDNTAIVRGTVTDADETPISGAEVIAESDAFDLQTTTTDDDGYYEFTLEVIAGQPTTNYTISVHKEGFDEKSVSLSLAAGNEVVRDFVLSEADDDVIPPDEEKSGPASNLVVVDLESSSIGVTGGGYNETTRLMFEARDSNGVPVDPTHAVEVMFSITGGPGGGEFLSPTQGKTDENGQVAVTLNAGILAGVVQIAAEATVGERTITSSPVKLSIHGGLPAQEHFGLATERINFPALQKVNARLGVVAVVGDKFSNPVRPGTNIYFRTNAGNIQTETTTDDDGVAMVELISLGKNINKTEFGPGFGYVVSETRGENGTLVADSVLVLLSGSPIISVNPATFEIPNNGTRVFEFTVADYNGNPMAEGQSISVDIDVPDFPGDVQPPELILNGDTEFLLPDTHSRDYTTFSFTLSVFGGEEEDVIQNMPVTIKITTSGPNGGAILNITGIVNSN